METAKKYALLSLIYVAIGAVKLADRIDRDKMREYVSKIIMKSMGGFMMTREDHEAGKKPGDF